MLRRIAKHLIERATIEADALLARAQRWINEPAERPAGAPESAPASPLMKPEMTSRWHSGAYHMEVLGSLVCPECGEAKPEKHYFCKACIEKKKQVAS